MKTLKEQNEEIQSALADICCKTACGKTCVELVAEIIEEVLKEKSSFDFLQKIYYNIYRKDKERRYEYELL